MKQDKLLWTERPRLLDRELETHAWMERERPWERFNLELVYDNAPGGWPRYAEVFAALWERCAREGTGFLVVESDVVPTIAGIESMLRCPERACVVPYRPRDDTPWETWARDAPSPGGWRPVVETDEWAVEASLGLCRFSPAACALPLPAAVRSGKPNVTIHVEVWRAMEGRAHLHWPGVRSNHDGWDEGDDSHFPEGRFATPQMVEALRERARATGGRVLGLSSEAS